MATIPTVPTEVPGNFWTAALWNANVLGGIGYLLAPVRFKGYSSTAQSILTGTTPVPLTLDTELWDSDGGHSTVTNTSRFTAQTAGLYFVCGSLTYSAANGTGTRTAWVFVNGVAATGGGRQIQPSSANGSSVATSTTVQLAVGDYVEIYTWENSGAASPGLTTTATPSLATTMELWRISA